MDISVSLSETGQAEVSSFPNENSDANGNLDNTRKAKVKFTVTPVAEEEHDVGDDTPVDESTALQFDMDHMGAECNNDTLTHNSITALLSSKFRDIQKRLKKYGIEAPKFRKRLVSKWESLNYDICENVLYIKNRDKHRSKRWVVLALLSKWLIMLGIGILTACLAAAIHGVVEELSHIKFTFLSDYFDHCAKNDCIYLPVLMWIGMNLVVTCLAAVLVTFLQQKAAGSGIPLIKAYLNGVKIPGLLSFRAFVAKTCGVVLSILGGLMCGKTWPFSCRCMLMWFHCEKVLWHTQEVL